MRSRLAICAALGALALALPSAPALGAESPSHPFLSELTGAEGAARTPSGAFEGACGLALDSHSDTYLADYYHNAVDVFGPSGEYLTQIASESLGNGPCALAVDSAGRVYVDNWRAEVVRFTPSAYPPSATTTYGSPTVIDSAGTATGLAIDPNSGNVYVDDGTYIAEREPSGALLRKIGENTFEEGYGLAVSSFAATKGDLYLADAATATVKVYDPATDPVNPVSEIDAAGTPQAGFAYLVDSVLAVDPSDGHIFVADNVEHGLSEHPAMVLDDFNPAGAYRGQIGKWITHPAGEPGVIVQHSLLDSEPPGLAIDSGGKVYVSSENSDGSESGALDKDGKPLPGSVLYTFGPTSPARTLTLTKSGTGVGTVTSAPAGIACGSACAAEYDEGAKVTLTATPDAHSAFSGWSGSCSGTASSCQVTMSAARSVSAEFAAIPQQPLTVSILGAGEGSVMSEPAGIACPGACAEEFNEGSTVTLTATPAPHSRFAGWGGLPCDELPTTTCRVTMSQVESIAAEFTQIPQQTLSVEVAGSGSGTVISSPAAISCPGTCGGQFDSEGPESTVTLTATPAPNDEVLWLGCGAQPSPAECAVAMSEARSVKATFTPILHTVAVSVAGAGSVSASSGAISGCTTSAGACLGAYAEGESITLTASPAAGSTFAGWSGACGGVGPCHLAIGADTAVSADFAAAPPPPIAAQLTLGKLTVKGATAALKISVSGPGTVVATGKSLKPASSGATSAGALTLPLALSGAGKKALARAKHRKLEVKVTVTFTPNDGGAAVTVTKTVTFKAGHGRHPKREHHSKHRRH